MAAYLKKVKEELNKFRTSSASQIPRSENEDADALARLATTRNKENPEVVQIEVLERPYIDNLIGVPVLVIYDVDGWIAPLYQYIKTGILLQEKLEVKKIRYASARYLIHDELLCRRGFSMPLLRCLDLADAARVLAEIHEGVCGDHVGSWSLTHKVICQG